MKTRIAQLHLSAKEEDAFVLEGSLLSQTVSYKLCMVGKLISSRRIHVPSFKEQVAAMWRPGRGVFVQELDDSRFLFKFIMSMTLVGFWKVALGYMTICISSSIV